ncbi:MAG: hypothetical protein KC416_14930 [Myxococcales bacterium]|nr:hypothetical protein [Myxococcales bacterium]
MGNLPTDVSMIVAERGSAWAPWVDRFNREGAPVEVIIQRAAESGSDFSRRIRRRIAEIAAEGKKPRCAVLVGGGRRDYGALRSRSTTVRALAACIARSGGGKVFLDSHGPDRLSMKAIAETIGEMSRGTGVVVRQAALARPLSRVA